MWRLRPPSRQQAPGPLTADELLEKGKKFDEGCAAIERLPLDETEKKHSKAYGKKRLIQKTKQFWDSL